MYRNILIAVDGSESSKRALLQAVHMANAGYEKMTAVYVLDRFRGVHVCGELRSVRVCRHAAS